MSFAKAIADAEVLATQRKERDLTEHFRVHGIPSSNDLGRLLAVKNMFRGISGGAFDRVLAKTKKSKH